MAEHPTSRSESSEGGGSLEPASRSTLGLEALVRLERQDLPVLHEIARGGMGVVYEVRDDVLRRDLAMKKVVGVPLPGSDSGQASIGSLHEMPGLLRRLLEEAQITAQLDHQCVVPVHALGIDSEGQLYFTMKRVRGRTLSDVFELVRQGSKGWTIARALHVFLRICETLSYAHGKGVIHRDLKPANVMVGRYGEVYVMDWGLAKVRGRSDEVSEAGSASGDSVSTVHLELAQDDVSGALTRHGDIVGTIGYMAPEQARGEQEEISERSDVWAVGAMLYELLAGHPPYRAPGDKRKLHEIVMAMRKEPPPALSTLGVSAPPELVAIVEKAMAWDPADRFPTAVALADEIHAYLDGRVVRSHRTGVWIELKKWVLRNKLLAGGILTGVLLAAATITAFVLQQRAAAIAIGRERDAAQSAAVRANGLRLAALARGQVSTDPARALELAILGGERAPGVASRNALLAALGGDRLAGVLQGHDGYVVGVRFTPDGQSLVTVDSVGAGVVWDVASQQARFWLDGEPLGDTAGFSFSQDVTRLAVGRKRGAVEIWDVTTGKLGARIDFEGRFLADVRFTQTAEELVVVFWDGGVEIRDAATGARRRVLESGRFPVALGRGPPVQFADGPLPQRLVPVYGPGRSVRLHDLTDDVEPLEVAPPKEIKGGRLNEVVLSPSEQMLWIATGGHGVLCDAATGAVLETYEDPRVQVARLRFAGAGTVLAMETRVRGGARSIRLLTVPDFELQREIPFTIGAPRALFDVGADGSYVVLLTGHDAEVWDTHDGTLKFAMQGHLYTIGDIARAPGGTYFATSCYDRNVRLWYAALPTERLGLEEWTHRGARRLGVAADAETALLQEPDDGEVFLVDTRTGEIVRRYDVPGSNLLTARAEQHGDAFWLVAADGRVLRLDAETAEVRVVARLDLPENALEFRVSPDEMYIAVRTRGEPPNHVTFRLADAAPVAKFGDYDMNAEFQWAPDSRRVAVAHSGLAVAAIYDALEGKRLHELPGHSGYVLRVGWRPDGAVLASSAVDTSTRVWDADTGRFMGRAVGMPMRQNGVEFSPTGELMVVYSMVVRVFHVSDDGHEVEEYATIPLDEEGGRYEAWFTPDGSQLATMTNEGRIRLWPMEPLEAAHAASTRRLTGTELQMFEVGTPEEQDTILAEAASGPGPYAALSRAQRLRFAGRWAEALEEARAAAAERPGWGAPKYEEACVLALRAGDPTRTAEEREADRLAALEALERAVDEGAGFSNVWGRMEDERAFDELRNDPRFRTLAEHARNR